MLRKRVAVIAAACLAALCPMLMAPSGGLPSRPFFQAVGVGVAAPAGVGQQTLQAASGSFAQIKVNGALGVNQMGACMSDTAAVCSGLAGAGDAVFFGSNSIRFENTAGNADYAILTALGNTQPAQPFVSAERITSTQNAPAATVTDIVFNSTNVDRHSNFATGTGIFTAPVAGAYMFDAQVDFQNNAVGAATLNGIYFSKNNATSGAGSRFDLTSLVCVGCSVNAASNAIWAQGAAIISLALNDTVRVKIDVGGANAFTVNTTSKLQATLLN